MATSERFFLVTLLLLLISFGLHVPWTSSFSIGSPWRSQRLGPALLDTSSDATTSSLTDWVVANLENETSTITSSSSVKAGENDTLPPNGLAIGKVRVFAADAVATSDQQKDHDNDDQIEMPIRLLVGRNGWGTGVHPSTRLCLEWVCQHVQSGELVLDYGCGSGILSIAALHCGARQCIGVDVEAEALIAAERNAALNDYGEERFEGWHTREVLPYGMAPVDVCVANILIGQLVRPSMVAALVSNLAVGGRLCFSGIRPAEVDSLKAAYEEHMEWLDDEYAELSADETEGSIESYGFDCGRWSRVVGRKRLSDNQSDIERMSELAVS